MKKLILFLPFFVLTFFVKAQTNIAPQFKRNIPVDSLLGYSIPGVSGNHWLPDTSWVKKYSPLSLHLFSGATQTVQTTFTASGASAAGVTFNTTTNASANNQILYGTVFNNTSTTGSFTNIQRYSASFIQPILSENSLQVNGYVVGNYWRIQNDLTSGRDHWLSIKDTTGATFAKFTSGRHNLIISSNPADTTEALGITNGLFVRGGVQLKGISSGTAVNGLGLDANGIVVTTTGGGGASGANPTSTAGINIVNGTATTFMRSDGAPKIDTATIVAKTFLATNLTGYVQKATASNGIMAFGNSIGTGTGATIGLTQGFYYLVNKAVGGQFFNYSLTGDQAADLNYHWLFPNTNPQGGGNDPVFMEEIGTNDVTHYSTTTNLQTVFKRIELSNLSWPAVPQVSKVFGQAMILSGFAADNNLQNGLAVTSTTNGNTATASITTNASSEIYLWYLIKDGNTGTFTVKIDGTLQADPYTSSTTINAFGDGGTAFVTVNGISSAVACLRMAVSSSGSHTVLITNNGTTGQIVTIYAIGTNPTGSTILPYVVCVSPNHQNNANDALSGTYAGFESAIVTQLSGDGLNVIYADTRSALGTNFGTYYQDSLHPNNAGHALMASTIEAALPTVLLKGNSLPNLNQPLQSIIVNAPINPSQFSSPNNGNLIGNGFNPGILWARYSNGATYATYYNQTTGLTEAFSNLGPTTAYSIGSYINAGTGIPNSAPGLTNMYMTVTGDGTFNFYPNSSNVSSTLNIQSGQIYAGTPGGFARSNSFISGFTTNYIQTPNAATSGSNQSSGKLYFSANVWSPGIGGNRADDFGWQNIPAAGTNPNVFLTMIHTNGGSGLWSLDISGGNGKNKLGSAIFNPSSTTYASINLPTGTLPTAPNEGDIAYISGTGLEYYNGASWVVTGGGSTYTNGYGLNLTSTTFSADTASAGGLVGKSRLATNLGGYVKTSALNTLTFGTHLTGTSYNTSSPVTIATDAVTTATASTLVPRDANADVTANSFLEGYTTTATAAGTTTLTVASTAIQDFTGSTTQIVQLPAASTLVQGQAFTVYNHSTGSVTVQSSGSNTILVIPNGLSATFTCILTSGTTATSWFANGVSANTIIGTGNQVFATNPTMSGVTLTGTTNTAAIIASGNIGTTGTFGASNFAAAAGATPSGALTNAGLLFGGISTVQVRNALNGTTGVTLTSGNSYANLDVGIGGTITIPTGTTSVWGVNAAFNTPVFSLAGSGVLNNSATAYFGPAPSVGTNKYTAYFDTGNVQIANGNINLATAGNKLLIATGSNASVGGATLSSGTVTVSTTAVTASSLIFVVYNTPSGTLASGLSAPVGSITAGTSFVINSLTTAGVVNTLDNSTVRWWIVN